MAIAPFEIIYEDQYLLAVNKPAGIPTMGVAPDRRSVVALLRQFLAARGPSDSGLFLGVVSRLDTPVTGVLLMAKDPSTAAHLCEQFRNRRIRKKYWALVAKAPPRKCGQWHDWLRIDRRHRKVVAGSSADAKALEAVTKYWVREQVGDWFLVELEPVTGRKHQLRWQLAAHEIPIVGDRKYGSRIPFPVGIALHARELEVEHPEEESPLLLRAPLPPVWRRLGVNETLAR